MRSIRTAPKSFAPTPAKENREAHFFYRVLKNYDPAAKHTYRVMVYFGGRNAPEPPKEEVAYIGDDTDGVFYDPDANEVESIPPEPSLLTQHDKKNRPRDYKKHRQGVESK